MGTVQSALTRPAWLGSSYQWPWWPQLSLTSASPSLSWLTPAWPGSCRSRDLTPGRESSAPPSPRRTASSTGRRASGTTRGLASTATSGTTGRPTLSSTLPERTASEFLEGITSLAAVRTLLTPSLSTLPGSQKSMIISTMTTPSQTHPSSTLTIPATSRNIYWMETWLDCWRAEPSPLPGQLPSEFQQHRGRTDSSLPGRSSLTDLLRDLTSTSSRSK